MTITEQAEQIRRKQQEAAKSRREEAKDRALIKEAESVDSLSPEDAAARERLEQEFQAAVEACDAKCKACPNADICIASLRNACPHFIRGEVASRKKEWFDHIKTKQCCVSCEAFDEEECWCKRHRKVVEADTDACEDLFPATTCGPCEDPDPLWYPDRPLSPKQQKIREQSRRAHAVDVAKTLRTNPGLYRTLRKMQPEYHQKMEQDFPDLFPVELVNEALHAE